VRDHARAALDAALGELVVGQLGDELAVHRVNDSDVCRDADAADLRDRDRELRTFGRLSSQLEVVAADVGTRTAAALAFARQRELAERADARLHRPCEHVDGSEKARHELARGTIEHVLRRTYLLDAPVAEHDDAVRDLERLFLIVRDEHGGDVQLVVEPPQRSPQVGADARVERAEWLV